MDNDLAISALRRQQDLLGDLIYQLEEKDHLDSSTCHLYEQITREVEKNLRRLSQSSQGWSLLKKEKSQ